MNSKMDRSKKPQALWRRGAGGAIPGRERKASIAKQSTLFAPLDIQPVISGGSIAEKPVDTSLFVGPVYDNTNQRKAVIKEQLSDITKRLHQTLHTYDATQAFDDTSKTGMVARFRSRLGSIADRQMKNDLESFLVDYEKMTADVSAADKERDELLLQLSDWFSTDHVDLDANVSFNEKDEKEINDSYAKTLANFEKLKNLQSQMTKGGFNKDAKGILAAEQRKLQKNVVNNINLMRTISIQTMRVKDDEGSPWRNCATEIVGMLKKTRLESQDEIQGLVERVKELVDQLEKQHWTIRSLTSESKRSNSIKSQLADENTELKMEIAQLKQYEAKYEQELDIAKKMIEKQYRELSKRKKVVKEDSEEEEEEEDEEEDDGTFETQTLSQMLVQIEGVPLKDMTSDPYILRTRVRQQGEEIENLTKKIKDLEAQARDFDLVVEAKDGMLEDLQLELDSTSNKVLELKSRITNTEVTLQDTKEKLEKEQQRVCDKCDGVTYEDIAIDKPSFAALEVQDNSQQYQEEIDHLTERVQYFKQLLADTELKLSDAFKEISQLRREKDDILPQSRKTSLQPPPTPEPARVKAKAEEEEEPVHPTPVLPQMEDVAMELEKLDVEEFRRAESEQPKSSFKPPVQKPISKAETRRKDVKLPPLKRQPIKFSRELVQPAEAQEVETKTEREITLFKVGDIQSKLNLLLSMIMDYVTSAGSMIFKDKAEEQTKIQGVKAFDFTGNENVKQKKDVNPKDIEAKQKKSQAFFHGQKACTLLKEVYELLSSSLGLQHDEQETIYRSFKKHQMRRKYEQQTLLGLQMDNGGRSVYSSTNRGHSHGIENIPLGWQPSSSGFNEFSPWEINGTVAIDRDGQEIRVCNDKLY